MASHPYISGPGNITQMIGFLRRNFPGTVNSDTVKKFGLASKNESYVINALQFIGLIDEEGKKLSAGADVLLLSEGKFEAGFEGLVKAAYKDLFETRGDDAWSLTKDDLTGYFRVADKTSDIIGARQAGVFQAFAALAGHEPTAGKAKPVGSAKPKDKTAKPTKAAKEKPATTKPAETNEPVVVHNGGKQRRDMAMTVRIEINLPAEGTRETYDAIFQSIRANLIDD
ncbi:MAG TPA: DUF5343 domain-containing protein [Ramlibacter sp.]